MKIFKILMILLLIVSISNHLIAQENKSKLKSNSKLKIDKPLANKGIQKIHTPKKTSGKAVTGIKPRENMCKALNLVKTEKILKEKIGRTMSLKLDRDYSSISLLSQQIPLEFGSYKVSKVGNDWTYYLNDINSRIVRIDYKDGFYQLLIEFENQNTEMKGICHGCRLGNKDRRAADINWKNPALLINLEPIAYNNSLILNPVSVNVLGKYDLNGLTDPFFPSITNHFENRVESIVREKLAIIFNSDEVKNLISSALKPEVEALRIGPIKNVDLSETKLFLCNY